MNTDPIPTLADALHAYHLANDLRAARRPCPCSTCVNARQAALDAEAARVAAIDWTDLDAAFAAAFKCTIDESGCA